MTLISMIQANDGSFRAKDGASIRKIAPFEYEFVDPTGKITPISYLSRSDWAERGYEFYYYEHRTGRRLGSQFKIGVGHLPKGTQFECRELDMSSDPKIYTVRELVLYPYGHLQAICEEKRISLDREIDVCLDVRHITDIVKRGTGNPWDIVNVDDGEKDDIFWSYWITEENDDSQYRRMMSSFMRLKASEKLTRYGFSPITGMAQEQAAKINRTIDEDVLLMLYIKQKMSFLKSIAFTTVGGHLIQLDLIDTKKANKWIKANLNRMLQNVKKAKKEQDRRDNAEYHAMGYD